MSTEPSAELPTRAQYVAQRRRWHEAQEAQERERDKLSAMTHQLLDRYSTTDLASWLAEDLGDDLGAHGVRHWDVRWHRTHDVPRDHATVKPA